MSVKHLKKSCSECSFREEEDCFSRGRRAKAIANGVEDAYFDEIEFHNTGIPRR